MFTASFAQNRSSQRSCSFKKAVLKIFCNIHRKAPVLESLFNKVACLYACNFIKKGLRHAYFSVDIAKFLRTPILMNVYERLLLDSLASWK